MHGEQKIKLVPYIYTLNSKWTQFVSQFKTVYNVILCTVTCCDKKIRMIKCTWVKHKKKITRRIVEENEEPS